MTPYSVSDSLCCGRPSSPSQLDILFVTKCNCVRGHTAYPEDGSIDGGWKLIYIYKLLLYLYRARNKITQLSVPTHALYIRVVVPCILV